MRKVQHAYMRNGKSSEGTAEKLKLNDAYCGGDRECPWLFILQHQDKLPREPILDEIKSRYLRRKPCFCTQRGGSDSVYRT